MELVVHFGEVLLHFIELHALHVDPGVFLAVGHAGLQAHVQVGVSDGRGGGAHGLEGQVNGLHAVGAHLQALQVLGLGDGMLGVGELAVAAGVAQVDDDGAGLGFGLFAHALGQVAGQQGGDLFTGLGQEGQGEHQQAGAEVKLAAAHTLNGTGHDLFQHFLLGAQLAVAVHLHGHMAVGGGSHIFRKLLHGSVAGVAFGLGMAHDHGIVAQVGVGIFTGGLGSGGFRSVGAGFGFAGGAGAGGRTAAGCQGQHHGDAEQQRNQFFHGLPPSF